MKCKLVALAELMPLISDMPDVLQDFYVFAEDLICVPASQAYVERIFSLCGLLYSGRRNAEFRSLEMTACLKLNQIVLRDTSCPK